MVASSSWKAASYLKGSWLHSSHGSIVSPPVVGQGPHASSYQVPLARHARLTLPTNVKVLPGDTKLLMPATVSQSKRSSGNLQLKQPPHLSAPVVGIQASKSSENENS